MDYLIFQSLDKLLKPIRSRISNLIQRAIIHRADDSGRMLQVSLGEEDTKDQIRHCQQFGFASSPPPSSDGLILFPSGIRDVGFCISTQSQKPCPVALEPGESAHYNHEGSSITLKKGGKIEIKNKENELVSVLLELVKQVENLSHVSAYAPPGGQYPGGNCTMSIPSFDISSVKEKLNSFKS